MKILTYSGSSARQTCASWQIVHIFWTFCCSRLFLLLYLQLHSSGIILYEPEVFDAHAQFQYKNSKYIAFDKCDLQLQATNLAEGQNAQPMLLGDSPDQSILQDSKCYFVAQFSHIFISCRLRGVWTNMLVNTANIEGAERDWCVLN